MRTQAERAAAFRALHQRPGAFIIPNPWDAGTARLLASLGFEALATTSLGLANSLGRPDGAGAVSRGEVLENCRAIAGATDLPVNADLENGYEHEPHAAAEMIRLAAEAGIVGGSIEDTTGNPAAPIYEFSLAVERVHAAAEVARSLPVPFILTARAENLLHGRLDLDDTIRRLQAFEKAGAEVLYAPGLRDLATIRAVVSSVTRPVNVVASFMDPSITLAQLSEVGVKRISVGGSLSRLALAAFLEGAREMKDTGGFRWLRDMLPIGELRTIFTATGQGESRWAEGALSPGPPSLSTLVPPRPRPGPRGPPRPPEPRPTPPPPRPLAGRAVAYSARSRRHPAAMPDGGVTMSSLRIALAQCRQTADFDTNAATIFRMMDEAARQRVQILCFPETQTVGYRVDISTPDRPVPVEELAELETRLADRCATLGMACILGTETPLESNPRHGKPYNSALVISETGKVLGVHHKTRLTPLDALAYTPGHGFETFELFGVRVGVVICFEGLRFPSRRASASARAPRSSSIPRATPRGRMTGRCRCTTP